MKYNRTMEETLNLKFTNQDFGLENTEYTDDYRTRYAARGIVLDSKSNKIALAVKTKINEFKLPGGGIEGNESEEDAFLREVFEETGCKVKIIKKLGTILEERSNINMKQISTIYLSELIEDTKELHPTQKEIDECLKVECMDVDDAIKAVRDSYGKVLGDKYENLYAAHFVIKRDTAILEFFKNTL